MISCQGLIFGYLSGQTTIDVPSLSISAHSMTAIIGPNGCGKSTLARLLTGSLLPRSGSVSYGTLSVSKRNRATLATKVAYVPQQSSRAFPFTALEVVLTGRTPHTAPFRLENQLDIDIALESLQRVGLSHLAQRTVTELSGGERQLVSVARAFAQQPECMLLDEPSASLDLKHRAGLIRLLRQQCDEHGLTVVMVTHDLNLLSPGFDRVIGMRDGRVVRVGTPDDVLTEPHLAQIYDDPAIRVRRIDGRVCVWSEVVA